MHVSSVAVKRLRLFPSVPSEAKRGRGSKGDRTKVADGCQIGSLVATRIGIG